MDLRKAEKKQGCDAARAEHINELLEHIDTLDEEIKQLKKEPTTEQIAEATAKQMEGYATQLLGRIDRMDEEIERLSTITHYYGNL